MPAIDRLTATRLKWLLQLEMRPQAASGRRRDATRDDCQALGWVRWRKDADGEYLHDAERDMRVVEELTDEGRALLAAWRRGERKIG